MKRAAPCFQLLYFQQALRTTNSFNKTKKNKQRKENSFHIPPQIFWESFLILSAISRFPNATSWLIAWHHLLYILGTEWTCC